MGTSSRLSILLICHRFPWPLTRGDTLTVFKMAEYFGRRHDLDIVCHAPACDEYVRQVRPLVRDLYCEPFSRLSAAGRVAGAILRRLPFQTAWCCSPPLRRRVRELCRLRKYDVVMPYYIRVVPCAEGIEGPAKVAAIQLSLGLQWQRAAREARGFLRRPAMRWESRRLLRCESETFRRFDKVLLISNRDRDAIPSCVDEKVFYNPHGVDTTRFAPDEQAAREPGSIVFTGLMQFRPNAEAICEFVRTTFPLVLAGNPNARLTIVGKNPPRPVRALAANPAITVTGTVPEICPYLQKSAVAIAPVRACAGLQNKVLEAMSAAAATVLTPQANEGIGARDGEHCLIREDPQSFADAVVTLLADAALRARLGNAARQWILDNWTWEVHFERLEAMLCDLAAQRAGTAGRAS